MRVLSLLFSLSFLFPCVSHTQTYWSELPPDEAEKRRRYCNNITMRSFSQEFVINLSNQLQVDPLLLRIHSVSFDPQARIPEQDSDTTYIYGVCKVLIAHPKGVYSVNMSLPQNLWFAIKRERRETPVSNQTEDYRDQCKDKYTPKNMRRNKQCELIY